jgi:hypothetical protein
MSKKPVCKTCGGSGKTWVDPPKPSGEFTTKVEQFLEEFEVVPENKNLYGIRNILKEACNIIDQQTRQIKQLEKEVKK